MFVTGYFLLCAFTGIVYGGNENQAKLRYYYNSIEEYTELPLENASNIFSLPWYNASRITTIFCHGFTGIPTGPAVTAVIKAYLERGEDNVILLNWDKLAASIYNSMSSSYLNYALNNAIKLGADFADTLRVLSAAGMDLNKTHLIGHSLGGQIFGIAGNNLATTGLNLPWITGLDPARIGFDSKRPFERLNPNSARFVDVIHSDPSKYGSRKSLGTVDFWPNYSNTGTVTQPGCSNRPHPRFSPEDLCNHNVCWQLLIDSVKYPGTILGSYAKNFRVWKNYTKQQRLEVVLELGKCDYEAVPGDYFLVTNNSSPYGLGEDGL